MSRYANRLTPGIGALALLWSACIVPSCGVVDVSALELTMHPSTDLTVLGEGDRLWVDFGLEVDRARAERCVVVRDDSGSIAFDAIWEGNRMTIAPAGAWSPGTRYELICEGTVYASDGREFPARASIRFFYISSSARPALVSWTPPDDAIVGTGEPIRLRFSGQMDGTMLDRHISVSPPRDLAMEIIDDGYTVIVSPVDGWEGMKRYRWTVAESLSDIEGKTLERSFTGTFRTYLDSEPVGAPGIFAVEIADASIRYPVGSMARGMGILLSFPEPIDTGSLKSRFGIEPDIDLVIRDISDLEILAYPEDLEWKPEQEYAVTIGKGVEDKAGNATTSPFSFAFKVAIPVIRVLSIANVPPGAHDPLSGDDLISGESAIIEIDISMGSHAFTITLSEPFSPVEAERLVKAVSVSAFFPQGAGNPVLASMLPVYENQNSITLDYRGFTTPGSDPEERFLYKLTIDGGEQGFALDSGARLADDFELLLETVQQ